MRDALYSPINRELSALMRAARVQAGITQLELAKKTGRTQAYISKFENGQLRLDVADFLLFSKCIGLDPHHVINDLSSEIR